MSALSGLFCIVYLTGEMVPAEPFRGLDILSQGQTSGILWALAGGTVLLTTLFVWNLMLYLRARRRAAQLKRSDAILSARLRLSEYALGHSLDDLLQKALDEAEQLTASQIGFFHFMDDDQNSLSLQNWSTNTLKSFCTAVGKGLHYPVNQAGVWVDCIHQRRTVIHNEYAALTHRKGMPPGHPAVQRELVTPVIRGGNMCAILGVGNKQTLYDDSDVNAIELLANLAWDIVQRKRTEEALRESEEKYRTLIDQAVEMLFLHDMEGRFIEVNQTAIKATGYSREELLHMTVYDIDPDADARHDKQQIWQSFSNMLPTTFEVRHRRKDGSIYWAEVRAGKLKLGGTPYILALANDITERKRSEQAREQLLKDLHIKNQELESIVFIASHDLRSPLVNIRGFAGELEKSLHEVETALGTEAPDGDMRQSLERVLRTDIPESLHFIKTSSQKMDSLLNGLLRLSRIGTAPIHPVEINMDQLIGGILGGLRFKIREFDIDIAAVGPLPACRGDLTLINQVFANLIDNAIKYRHPDRRCRIRIRGRRQEDRCRYEIEDNGVGIAPEHREKIFEIFHQLNPSAGGEGLGLTIVRRILDRENGTIEIDSQAGTGTMVIVSLPGLEKSGNNFATGSVFCYNETAEVACETVDRKPDSTGRHHRSEASTPE